MARRAPSTTEKPRRSIARWTGGLMFGIGLAAYVAWRNRSQPLPSGGEPVSLPERLIRLRYATTFWVKLFMPLLYGKLRDKRFYVDDAGETLALSGSQGQTLAATLYRPAGAGIHPGIVLLHGSTPAGRKLGMYRLLGREFAARGYVVLSLDQRGYGDSDDPRSLERPEDLDFPHDARIALRYLANLQDVDADRVYLVGHSFGGDVAITASIDDAVARKVVVIGPGRRYNQRAEKELDHFRLRATEYMRLPRAIPLDVFVRSCAAFPLENHLDHFRSSQHKPLLLIDGSHESSDDVRFLEEMFASIAEPKKYYTLPNADHYANITGLGSLVIYDQQALDDLMTMIDTWLRENDE